MIIRVGIVAIMSIIISIIIMIIIDICCPSPLRQGLNGGALRSPSAPRPPHMGRGMGPGPAHGMGVANQ